MAETSYYAGLLSDGALDALNSMPLEKLVVGFRLNALIRSASGELTSQRPVSLS
jgi:hypothetical protein